MWAAEGRVLAPVLSAPVLIAEVGPFTVTLSTPSRWDLAHWVVYWGEMLVKGYRKNVSLSEPFF